MPKPAYTSDFRHEFPKTLFGFMRNSLNRNLGFRFGKCTFVNFAESAIAKELFITKTFRGFLQFFVGITMWAELEFPFLYGISVFDLEKDVNGD